MFEVTLSIQNLTRLKPALRKRILRELMDYIIYLFRRWRIGLMGKFKFLDCSISVPLIFFVTLVLG